MSAAHIVIALFNGAWQGALLCGLALLAFPMFRRLNATTMFALWSALLGICLTLPLANLAFAPKPYTIQVASARPASRWIATAPIAVTASHRVMPPHRVPSVSFAKPSVKERLAGLADAAFARAWIALVLLAAVAVVRLLILLRDIARMVGARRRVRIIEAPVSLSGSCARPFRFGSSTELASPCVLGFVPPLIVLPQDVLNAHEQALLSIVLHEREHVRRFDDVQNVLARLVAAVAFFLPGVRIALRELALYREQICDDAAIDGTGNRISYAMTLTDMAQWAQGRGVPVPSLIFKRKQLVHRLEVLLDTAVNHSLRMDRRFAVNAAVVIAIAAVLVARVQVPVVAENIAPPPPAPRVRAPAVLPAAPKAPARTVKTAARAPQPPRPARKAWRVSRLAPRPVPPAPLRVPPVHIAPLAATPHVLQFTGRVVIAAPQTRDVRHTSDDLLDALSAAGMRNVSADELILLRDHGVSADLVRASASYSHARIESLAYLADHGISPAYLESVTRTEMSDASPQSVVLMQEHGVRMDLLREAMLYFSPRPTAEDLAQLADHGVTATCLEGFRSAGLYGVGVTDAIRLLEHGVSGVRAMKIRRVDPRATIDDIIRLHDNGF